MKNFKFLLLMFCLPAFASVNPTCYQQPQEIGFEIQVIGFQGSYVGVTSTNKPVFYNPKIERLYVFENGLNEIPVEIPWNRETDLRWKQHEHDTINIKTFSDYKAEGIGSYLSSLGVRCGTATPTPHPLNNKVISDAKTIACTEIGKSPSAKGGTCCEGAVYNSNSGICDEPNFRDPQYKTCTSNSQCQVGMGCLPQTSSVLFTTVSDNFEVSQFNEYMRGALDEQMTESEFFEVGKSCTHSAQCASYNCENKVCQEARICRYGEEAERIDNGTKCNESKHLVRNSGGICETSPEAQHALYLGLYPENFELFTENAEIGQCQFGISQGVRERTTQALKSIRAMEWLLASMSRSDSDDCFRVNKKLREKVGIPFLEQRKHLLNDFSMYYSAIKKDHEIVQAAMMSNMDSKVQSDKVVEIHGPVSETGDQSLRDVITEYELATRQESGYDMMMFMYRRNLLFQSYEKGMLLNVGAAYEQIASLSQEMAKWKDGDTRWNLGDEQVSAYNCKAKYKKFDFRRFKWRTKHYNNVANRWTDYYEVAGNQKLNLDVVKSDGVLEQLKIIGSFDDDESVVRAFNRHHFLIDPLMPGKTSANGVIPFTRYGDKKDLNGKPSSALKRALQLSGDVTFFGIGSLLSKFGKKDQRTARYLLGESEMKSYSGMKKDFRQRIIQFYREMKINATLNGFVYEPELISSDAADCIDKMDQELAPGDKCVEFNQYIEDITDYGMAHFLAYSYHTSSKYSGYFTNARTWRRRLLTRLEVDLQNLELYYREIINIREKQISCLEALIGHVDDKYLNGGNTVGQGGQNYYDGGKYDGKAGSGVKVNGRIGQLTAATRQNFSFNPNTSAWKGIADSLIGPTRENLSSSTNSAGDSSASGEGNSSTFSAFNKRRELMDNSNKKLSEKGINVSEKDSKFLASLGRGGPSSSSKASGNSSGNSSGINVRGYSAGGGFDLNHKGNLGGDLNGANGASSLDGDLNSGNQFASLSPGGAGLNSNSRGGHSGLSYSEGQYGSGDGLDGNGGAGPYQDPTGMSDHEKEIMMANLERTKGRYNPDDTDTLFDVVSKAYVRNLEKILTRKKFD